MRLLRTAPASILTASLLAASFARGSDDSVITSVFSSISNGYTREVSADGSPKPEYYAIAKGKYMPGGTKDQSIDSVEFPIIAGTVAKFLARKNYFLAQDAKSAGLLLMITWGTTIPFDDGTYRNGLDSFLTAGNGYRQAAAAVPAGGGRGPDGIQSPEASVADAARSAFESQLLEMQMFEAMRMRSNERNANLLGYLGEINYRNNPSRFGGAGSSYDDLISDIENERYFVIVAAYDFHTAVKTGKQKLLWVTRVSIQKSGNKFDKEMTSMVAQASRYFGSESKRLVRQYQKGTVTLGERKVVGFLPDAADKEKESAPKK